MQPNDVMVKQLLFCPSFLVHPRPIGITWVRIPLCITCVGTAMHYVGRHRHA